MAVVYGALSDASRGGWVRMAGLMFVALVSTAYLCLCDPNQLGALTGACPDASQPSWT